jgi:hypothetical protein
VTLPHSVPGSMGDSWSERISTIYFNKKGEH